MPGLDRTGPEGKGSQRGRGMGRCNPGNNVADETRFGRGQRRGQKQGRGNRGFNGQGRGLKNGSGFNNQ